MKILFDRLPDQVGGATARETLQRGVDLENVARSVHENHAEGTMLEDGVKALLGSPSRLTQLMHR